MELPGNRRAGTRATLALDTGSRALILISMKRPGARAPGKVGTRDRKTPAKPRGGRGNRSVARRMRDAGAPGGAGAPAYPGPCDGRLGRPGIGREAPTLADTGEVARAQMQAVSTGGRKVKSV